MRVRLLPRRSQPEEGGTAVFCCPAVPTRCWEWQAGKTKKGKAHGSIALEKPRHSVARLTSCGVLLSVWLAGKSFFRCLVRWLDGWLALKVVGSGQCCARRELMLVFCCDHARYMSAGAQAQGT